MSAMTINRARVLDIAEKARAVAEIRDDTFTDGNDFEVELDLDTMAQARHHDELAEEELGDQSADELRGLIDTLNADEAAELVALIWIGRGDMEAADWDDATRLAVERADGPTSAYVLRMPMVADHIESGLDAVEALNEDA